MPAFKTFNFFIGANNAGKSTVLNFINKHMPPQDINSHAAARLSNIDPLERHGGEHGRPIYMALGYTREQALNDISRRYPATLSDANHRESLSKILDALADDLGLIWKGSNLPYENTLKIAVSEHQNLQQVLPTRSWAQLWGNLLRMQGGGIDQWISGVTATIAQALDTATPPVRLIPAIRQISSRDITTEDFSGAGLISRLAEIQNPEHNRRNERKKFDHINEFLRFVTGRPNAEIEVPFSREHILVHMDGRILPLSSLGTGVQEVIMIAAFCTLADEQIVCIEEPEIHLHPLLQRKLINYLADATQNQYFIATHSAAFIDTPGAAIFHVTLENNTTHIREAVLRKDRFAICVDLGHRASDIVQANAIVWVEGPADRIYLQHWINIVAPDIVEGIHYSIMFYGGRLLSHLSAVDDEVSEFIQLRSLNRHLAILMDSDKSGPHARVNATKLRLKDEFGKGSGVAWITKGREIENYVDHARLQLAVKDLYSGTYGSALPQSPFDHALHFIRLRPKKRRKGSPTGDPVERDADKVKVSRAVVAAGPLELDVLDLRDRLTEIVAMIRRANK